MDVLVFKGEIPEDLRNRCLKHALMTKSKQKIEGKRHYYWRNTLALLPLSLAEMRQLSNDNPIE
jgi:hypothetical protein